MAQVSEEILARLNALNLWLKDVFGEGTRLSGLLLELGFDAESIQLLKTDHLAEYVDLILSYIKTNVENERKVRSHDVMLRHYGLHTGHKETLQQIADDFNLSRERIRQLCAKRIKNFKHPARKAKTKAELVTIAQHILGIETSHSENIYKPDWLEEIRKTYPRAYESWGEEECAHLKQLFEAGMSTKEIAATLLRQPSAIRARLKKMALIS